MKRLTWILTLPLIIVIVAFAAANFDPVSLDLWPFERSLSLPLSMALLASLVLGLLIGGLAAWLSGGRTRRRARQARRRVEELERELARRARDRAEPDGTAGLPAPTRDPGPRGKRSAVGS